MGVVGTWKTASIVGQTDRLLRIVPRVIQGWDFTPTFKLQNLNGLTSNNGVSVLGHEIPVTGVVFSAVTWRVMMTLF